MESQFQDLYKIDVDYQAFIDDLTIQTTDDVDKAIV